MSKYKTGKELIQQLEIRDFELLEYVKEGHQPLDQFGRPVPPPDISAKLKRLERLRTELRGVKFMPWELSAPILEKIKTVEKELDCIENKDSWANYELPEDDNSAQQVIDLLLNAFFGVDEFLKKDSCDEARDKSKDKKQCREAAKKYVLCCNANGKIPAIAEAIKNIRSSDYGSIYSEKQVRNWITSSPIIFPKESSNRGRRKNS